MSRKVYTSILLAGAALVWVACGASAEDKPAGTGAPQGEKEMAEMMAKWQKIGAPADHHKKLEHFVGKWNTTTKIWMNGPTAPPTETSGMAEVRWVVGGRFLLEEAKGSMFGMPFEGIGLTGYDNFQNRYVSSWVDNMNTHLLTMSGQMDPAGKVFTAYGLMDEPMMNIYARHVKYVTRIVDANKHTFEVIDLAAGDNYKVFEITYARKQ